MSTLTTPLAISRLTYFRLGILSAALFVVGTNAFVIAGVLSDVATDFHTTERHTALAITAYACIVAVASPTVTIAFAHVDRTRLMSLGMALIALGTALVAIAPNFGLFVGGRAVAALGGAALVPAAQAAAPTMLPETIRGRAVAISGMGFTLAAALGSPLGTALAGIGGWRLAMWTIAVMAAVVAVLIAVFVREVPLPGRLGWNERFAALRELPILYAIGAAMFGTIAFNTVYLFASVTEKGATGGSSAKLTILFLLYGGFAIVGNYLGGRLVDTHGARRIGVIGYGGVAVVFVIMELMSHSFWASAAVFAVWPLLGYCATTAASHRQVDVDPERAAITLGWNATGMYIGITAASLLGSAALGGGAAAVDGVGAIAMIVACSLFAMSFAGNRGTDPHAAD